MRKKQKKPEEKSKVKEEIKLEKEVEKAENAITHKKLKVAEVRDGLRETLNEEKEIEQEFFEEPIRTIPISIETSSPVLERIIQRQEQMPVENFTNQQEERGERRIDYSPATNQPNYGFQRNTEQEEKQKYESSFVPPVLSRREMSGSGMRQEFLHPQNETWQGGRSEAQLEGIDILENETRLPFETENKYKGFRLR